MPVIARRTGAAISNAAKQRLSKLKHYPTLDTFRNPLTRGIARHYANETWLKTLKEIDFEYRITDIEIAGIRCSQYETGASTQNDTCILYVHGGGFVAGSPQVNATTALPVCMSIGCQGVGVDYTLLPDAYFPTQIDQVDKVYKALLAEHPTRRNILLSDSAGSTIALAAMMRWRDEGVTLPTAAVFISPLLDGKAVSDTHHTLDGHDPLIKSNGGRMIRKLYEFYAPGEDVGDSRISPIYGNFSGLPPMLVQAGSREVCLGDAARVAQSAKRAGVDATLQIFDGLFHLFHMHWGMEEAKQAHADIAAFIKKNL